MSSQKLFTGLLSLLIFYGPAVICQTNRGTELQGQVRDLSGQPIANASIEIFSDKLDWKSQTKSDSKGRYKLNGLLPGRYTIVASYLGFRREERMAILRESEPYTLNFGLEVGWVHDPFPIQISGVVTSSSKQPLEDVNVTIV